jgi:hypothetical protein
MYWALFAQQYLFLLGLFLLTSVMVHDAFRQGESVFGFDLDRVGKAVLN